MQSSAVVTRRFPAKAQKCNARSRHCLVASTTPDRPVFFSFEDLQLDKPCRSRLQATTNNVHPEIAEELAKEVKPIVAAAAKKTAAVKSKPFANTQRFWVPEERAADFDAEWSAREQHMKECEGFQGFEMNKQAGGHVTCTSKWASIPQWEAYSLSDAARRSHLPWGVYQYVPKKGEGFPEDHVPFKDFKDFVNAKY